jgi:hypothetical protein
MGRMSRGPTFLEVLLLRFAFAFCAVFSLTCAASYRAEAQTASTGAVTGIAVDPAGLAVPGVTVQLVGGDLPTIKSCASDADGWFRCSSVPPGTYQLQASRKDFKPLSVSNIAVHVTETLRLELHLELATIVERAQVSANPVMVQLDTSALGRTVDREAIVDLPLATRNFSQLAGLSPGVLTGVYNAGELGTGGTAQSQIGPSNDGLYVHGARSYDNNWQLDGISVSDVLSTSSASGGIPIPNPDALEEFKVQTGLYDAAFGRAVGSNVSVITKTGGNTFHGSIFEFLRNEALNANDYFSNKTGQKRPPLKQNQFGFVFGGPVRKDRLAFFGSYQGTRQTNGIAAGQVRVACTASLNEPPLTDDRSAEALGSLFDGQRGALGGVTVHPDGSNINAVALALLNLKLPNGSFLIPNPQTVDSSRPLASQGFSVFSQPCSFSEDQLLLNLDMMSSQVNQFTGRFFFANSDQSVTFPGGPFLPVGNIPGFSSPGSAQFAVFSLAYTRVVSNARLNETRIGFVRTRGNTGAGAPFAWSDVGVAEGNMNRQNQLPSLQILGSVSMTPAAPRIYTQNSFVLSDIFSGIMSAHALRFGGSVTRLQDPLNFTGFNSFVGFLSWPDFLLGLDAVSNGTGIFSNIYTSGDIFALGNREFRAWEVAGFADDDYRIRPSLTLNLGLRYEHLGQFGDNLGRNSSFDAGKANANPPPDGSLDGYIVASNFNGALPPGVIRASNTFGTYGDGQNTMAPRIGFAWRMLPQSSRMAMRGGYGIYYSRPTGQSFTVSVLSAPFGLIRNNTGLGNAKASFQYPFVQPFPTADSFPLFAPYSPTTNSSMNTLAPDFRPAIIQQYSLNLQAELRKGWLLETGYVGVHGTHLQRLRSLNQALDASQGQPIRGVTSNTVANVGLRVPVPGIRPDSLRQVESEGVSEYSGLEASLAKGLSHGIQFLASYTYSKTFDTDGANVNGTSATNTLTLGDQNSSSQRWGRTSFDRTHRLVFSGIWALPGPSEGAGRVFLGGWTLAAVPVIQSGSALTIADTNANNVFGISEDRAQLSGACNRSQLIRSGSVQSNLNHYFDTACFAPPPVIGADKKGTGFGNSSTGITNGPGQANLDLALAKAIALGWPHDGSSIEVRGEFFNALNHPQFANPDTNFTSPTFGVISSTSVNPRVGQVAVRFSF